jgi:Polyketide cyclase / dehydrase and lipid transport
VLTYRAPSEASAATAWELFAQPVRWSEWAPHVRGAWGLGEPEVEVGRRGVVRLLGAVPIPARVTAKRSGRSWAWRVGPVELVHRVEPRPAGCLVAVDVMARAPLEAVIRRSYGPIVALMVRNLARVAADVEASSPSAPPARATPGGGVAGSRR